MGLTAPMSTRSEPDFDFFGNCRNRKTRGRGGELLLTVWEPQKSPPDLWERGTCRHRAFSVIYPNDPRNSSKCVIRGSMSRGKQTKSRVSAMKSVPYYVLALAMAVPAVLVGVEMSSWLRRAPRPTLCSLTSGWSIRLDIAAKRPARDLNDFAAIRRNHDFAAIRRNQVRRSLPITAPYPPPRLRGRFIHAAFPPSVSRGVCCLGGSEFRDPGIDLFCFGPAFLIYLP